MDFIIVRKILLLNQSADIICPNQNIAPDRDPCFSITDGSCDEREISLRFSHTREFFVFTLIGDLGMNNHLVLTKNNFKKLAIVLLLESLNLIVSQTYANWSGIAHGGTEPAIDYRFSDAVHTISAQGLPRRPDPFLQHLPLAEQSRCLCHAFLCNLQVRFFDVYTYALSPGELTRHCRRSRTNEWI